MPLIELTLLTVLAAWAWLWLDGLKAREVALAAARAACRAEGLQLLDETVASTQLGLGRDEEGRLQWRRVYVFEYSVSGEERRAGSLVLLGRRVLVLNLHAAGTTVAAFADRSERS